MNQITQSANPTPNFGYDFDYAVWTANTKIDLVNVPFNNDARDVLAPSFNIDSYIDSLASFGVVIDNMSYVRPNHPVRINIPFNVANKYNYLRASNPAQPVSGDTQKTFYYFILTANYLAPNTTELILQLDVWQTYVRDIQFGNCYVESGHIGVANENQMDHYGRDYLSIPDGMDIGTNYRTISQSTVDIAGRAAGYGDFQSLTNIMVVSSVDLTAAPNDTDGKPTLNSATGSELQSIASGADIYLFKTMDSFKQYLNTMSEFPWVTQGIISVTMVPTLDRYVFGGVEWPANGVPYKITTMYFYEKMHSLNDNWRSKIFEVLPTRYKSLNKFVTSPYCMIEMTTWSGTPIQLKPELWNRSDLYIMERATYMPPNQRVQFYPKGYNTYATNFLDAFGNDKATTKAELVPEYITDSEFENTVWPLFMDRGDDYGDYLDMVTQINSFPSVPIINNMAISYLASNTNSFAFERNSADWSQQRAIGSAQAQYDVATGAISTNRQLTDIGINADTSQTGNLNRTQAAQAVTNLIGDTVTGAIGGSLIPGGGALVGGGAGLASGITNAINTGIQISSNDEALAIRNRAANRRFGAESGQMALSRDTNKDLANWAARGDYSNTIAGINAKVRDAQLIQPSVNGQFGGEVSNMIYGTMELSIRIKFIDLQAIRTIGEYWLRYGYPVRTFMNLPSSLMVMTKFTYWKLTETYIKSAKVPEEFKQVIRGILEKGVTVWANPDDIGTIDMATNQPIAGVSY